jgi:hypothetical protein
MASSSMGLPLMLLGADFRQVHAAPQGTPRMWTLAFEHHEDRTPTHGYGDARGRDGRLRQRLAWG